MLKVGYALTGSFCTFSKTLVELKNLVDNGYDVYPIMSQISYETDTRFGKAEDFRKSIEQITGKEIIHTIKDAEPIGPKALFDILIIAPTTGNTLAKIANGVNDTCVTMAAKAHLRNSRPLVIAVSTNDALSAAAGNIGKLMNTKNIYFVPMKQDNFLKKPTSVVADFAMIEKTLLSALKGEQIQPVLL
jgi:dipicolinate synthase subunit B